jgi:hypothetical protein
MVKAAATLTELRGMRGQAALFVALAILLGSCGGDQSADVTPTVTPAAKVAQHDLVDLANGYEAQWTNDGKIVYVGDGGIWEIAGDGTDLHRIVDLDFEGGGLLLSPDRSKMLVMHGGENSIANVDGTSFRPVADVTASSSALWSDDGSMVTFMRLDGVEKSIWAVSARGGEPRMLFPDFGGFVLAWTRDERMVVRAHFGSGARVYLVQPGQHRTELLTESGASLWEARFRSDGSIEGIAPPAGMVAFDGRGRELTPFPAQGRIEHLPDHSPDGKLMVYESDEGVWLARADGREARKLTSENCGWPSFSPDGTLVVCSHMARIGGTDEYGHPLQERRVAVIPVPTA